MTRTPTNALRSAFRAAIDQADPQAAVARHMTALSRNANGRMIVIAAGKAAPAMLVCGSFKKAFCFGICGLPCGQGADLG